MIIHYLFLLYIGLQKNNNSIYFHSKRINQAFRAIQHKVD